MRMISPGICSFAILLLIKNGMVSGTGSSGLNLKIIRYYKNTSQLTSCIDHLKIN